MSDEIRAAGIGRKRLVQGVVVVALLAGAVWGFQRWSFGRSHVSTDNAQVDGHIVPVLAKVGGYVQEVFVEENQRVARGDLVVSRGLSGVVTCQISRKLHSFEKGTPENRTPRVAVTLRLSLGLMPKARAAS